MQSILVQIKTILIKVLCSNKNLVTQNEYSKSAIQDLDSHVESLIDAKLKLKCKRAQDELRYIKKFTHWPVSELKTNKHKALDGNDNSKKNNSNTDINNEHLQ